MGNGNDTGARSNAGNARREVKVMNGLGSQSGASRGYRNVLVGAGRHDQVKPRSYSGILNMRMDTHGDAVHATMAGDTQRHVSICLLNPEPPDSPTGSPRRHADLPNELESHAYGMWMARIHLKMRQ